MILRNPGASSPWSPYKEPVWSACDAGSYIDYGQLDYDQLDYDQTGYDQTDYDQIDDNRIDGQDDDDDDDQTDDDLSILDDEWVAVEAAKNADWA